MLIYLGYNKRQMNTIATSKKLFVISDAKRITRRMQSIHVDFRTVVFKENHQEYLVASSKEVLLEAVKSSKDPYNILQVNSRFLDSYCKKNKLGALLITSCYCDLDTRKPIVEYTLIDKDNI